MENRIKKMKLWEIIGYIVCLYFLFCTGAGALYNPELTNSQLFLETFNFLSLDFEVKDDE